MAPAGRPKVHKSGSWSFVYKTYDVKDFDDAQLVGRSPREVREMTKEIAAAGLIIQPIITTVYNGKTHLQDGAKRILASRALAALTTGEATEEGYDITPSDFKRISAKEFQDVSPNDIKAWALILNEQRSDNAIAAWLRMKKLQEDGEWEAVAEMHFLNKSRFARLSKLNDLAHPDEFVQAFQDGKLAESTLFGVARMGKPRQKYLLTVLQEKDKLTGPDLKEAKTAKAATVLSAMPEVNMLMPKKGENYEPPPVEKAKELFAIISNGNLVGPFDGFHPAHQEKLDNGGDLYRLIKI